MFGRSAQDDVDLRDLTDRVTRLETLVVQLQAQLREQVVTQPASSVPGAPASPVEADFMAEVRALAASGKKINAIKVYREHTRVGLKEAKDAVEQL